MPRGRLSAIGVTSALVIALAGCSSSSGSPAGTGPAAGKTLVVGVTSDPDTFFPWKATQFTAVNVLQNLYGTLTEFDKDLNVVPGLAESWKTSDDGRKLTLKLRQGVTFGDGSAFDSEDVKWSLDQIMAPATAAVARASLSSVKSVTAPDPSTVVLELTGPDAALPANLATVNLAMLSTGATEAELSTRPNGTGPFTLRSRTASQSITLARNDRWWGADKPKVSAIEFRVIPDESSIVAAMQSGNVQLTVLNDPLVARTAQAAGVGLTRTPQLNYHVLQLNARRGELADVNVRLAIQCAIDRKQVLDTAALGEGEVVGPITSPAFKSDPARRPCPARDLAKAAEYLGKAGKSGGVTLKTIVSQGEYATSVNEAQNLKAQLAEAKINLELEVLESGAYVDRWNAADFDAAVALNGGRPDPDGSYGRYFTSGGNFNRVAGYSSPELDKLFADGKATTDQAARKAIYDQVSAHLEDNAVWIWLFSGYTYTATTAGVRGFVPMANGSLQYLRTTSAG
ncbi:ABC transporter substrate-binding protein [Nonomuraea jiangxiensis]|uniref:Peptide/nickel transport system substrate-binding protein n=1 Tax=Nonomuraea jiangxiensis TaxID=633440 RepID=A0A1G9M6Z5_9ACTN|nr:ABC transporter substrate-binding protein [Nonomuraea jiangxiensis]SDL70050.1 peptide/nickel transport system substrate-binding protein [Nonomuraea jiangxiensis]